VGNPDESVSELWYEPPVTDRRPGRPLLVLACTVAVLDSIFIAALAPLLPYYSDLLGIESGLAGVLSASYSIGLLMGSLPAGIVTARLGERRALALALAVLAASSVVFGLAGSYGPLVAARTLEGAASALAWTSMLAWLVAVSTPGRRARLLGLVFGAAFLGFTLGPVLGAIAVGAGPRSTFVAMGAFSGALAVWTFFLATPERRARTSLAAYARLIGRSGVPYSLLLQALPGALVGATTVVASLRLAELGSSAATIAAAFVIAGAVQGLASPIAGRWTDRIGPMRPIRSGLVVAAVACLATAIPGLPALVIALLAVSWIAFALVLVPATALLTRAVERARGDQSLGFALMNLAFAPGALIGSVAAGVLRDRSGDVAALGLVSILCLATLAVPPPAVARGRP
jgi:predicted MFS family arabinose efflux permease